MVRHVLLAGIVVLVGCSQGTLDGPGGTFGLPMSTTQSASDTGDDGDATAGSDGSGAGEGEVGGSSGAASDSSGMPVSASAEGSSDGSASASASMTGDPGSSSGDASASAGDSMTSADDGNPPPPDAGAWDDCSAATCEVGTDCISITGLRAYSPYCSPTCVTDADCDIPATGDALPACALAVDGAIDPTNCALICEYDGLDYGTCPNGMTCASIPGQAPTISMCMW